MASDYRTERRNKFLKYLERRRNSEKGTFYHVSSDLGP
jgi:hypothetical protein